MWQELVKKIDYPLALQLVTDEEVGGFDGTKYQVDKGVRADFVIVGESTNLDIENKSKGILWLKIFAKGKTAHGAYPWKGENAIRKMNRFLDRLVKEYPDPKKEQWITTVNVSRIETPNKTFNKIPDYCEVWLDVRYIPEESKTILKSLKKLVPNGFILEIVANEPALSTSEHNPYLTTLRKSIKEVIGKTPRILSANGSSDARHYARIGCPAIEFGPGGKGMGSDKEWIKISDLEKYTRTLTHFLLSLS